MKIGERVVDVVKRVRPLGMPGEPDALPRSKIGKNLPACFIKPFFDELDFLLEADVHRMRFRMLAKFVQLVLQFDNWLLEIELVFHA